MSEAREFGQAIPPIGCEPDASAEGGTERGADLRRVAAERRADRLERSQWNVPLPGVLWRLEQRPFAGRADVLARLRGCWEQAAQARAGLVLLSGEPGIGKTRVAARFAAAAHRDGAVVLYGRADEQSIAPYQPFVEALRHVAAHQPGFAASAGLSAVAARELSRLVPELSASVADTGVGPEETFERRRPQLFDAVVRVLLAAARSQRLLLVLDDLHWADVPSMLLLRQLLRRGAGAPLLVLAAYSDVDEEAIRPLARVAAALRTDAPPATIRLTGLRPSDVVTLVGARVGRGAPDEALAQRLCAQTGGNPFFIEELLRAGEALEHPIGVPESVKEVLGRRLERLSPVALDTLTLAAVLGRDFRLAALEVVASEHGLDELLDALEAAVKAGLVVEDPGEVDRFSFTHALVRETLYERPIASRRLRLHLRVAEALEASPLPVHPGELAHHYFHAREVGGAAKAVVFGLRAGEAAQAAHAYEDAVAHYERALCALEILRRDDTAARCDVLLALGAARWQASEPDPRATFARAVELARELDSPGRLARAALGAGGRFYAPVDPDVDYIDLLEEVLRALEPGDSTLRVRLLARLAENLVFVAPADRASTVAGEAVEMARRLGEPGALAAALMGRHAALLHVEHATERRRLGEEALALSGELGALELGALARHWLLYDLAELGELGEARRRYAELDVLAAELQQPLYRHATTAWGGVWAGLAGRFEEAEQLACRSVRLAEHGGDPYAQAHFTAQLVAVRREQGRLDELLPQIERYAGDRPAAAAWLSVLPLAYLDAGEPKRAHAAYQRALAAGVAALPRTMHWLSATGSLAEAAAELGDRDGCTKLYAALEPFADRLIQWTFTGNAGAVHRLLGRTAAVAGRPDRARIHYDAALARHEALGAPALLARTRCDYGELLLQGPAADHPRALNLLYDATATADRLGMVGIAERARLSG
jgi:tetratricopeptide (TPR) repeat protein